MAYDFYRQLGTGVSSLTFGAALSIFVYAVASGIVSGLQAWLLFGSSFLLMLRFWWRYSELFVRYLPSRTYWHFLFDFAVSFFGILAVLSVGSIKMWSMLGAFAMLASIVRCSLSSKEAAKDAKLKLRRTFLGAFAMFIVMLVIYGLASAIEHVLLASAAFIIILVFVVYSSIRS